LWFHIGHNVAAEQRERIWGRGCSSAVVHTNLWAGARLKREKERGKERRREREREREKEREKERHQARATSSRGHGPVPA